VFWNGRRFRRGGPLVPPEALCAEFAAGKEGADGASSTANVGGGGGGRLPFEARCAELAAGKEGAGPGSDRVKEGTAARGVVGEEAIVVLNGGGGGGIALRSSCTFATMGGGGIAF